MYGKILVWRFISGIKSRYAMRPIFYLISLILLPLTLQAGGVKKKKRKIYIRRELVALGQATAPFEYHNDSATFHSLICRGTGLQSCGWARPPLWRDPEFSLEKIEQVVMGMMKWQPPRTEGYFGIGVRVDVHWRRLPNGYEYSIEEGVYAPTNIDVMAARAQQGGPRRR